MPYNIVPRIGNRLEIASQERRRLKQMLLDREGDFSLQEVKFLINHYARARESKEGGGGRELQVRKGIETSSDGRAIDRVSISGLVKF